MARKRFDIAGGRYNADIDAESRALKAHAAPVYFSFHHEPEINKSGTMGTPASLLDECSAVPGRTSRRRR